MSWRETLGVLPSTESPNANNSQNAQNLPSPGNCADIADYAYKDTEEDSKLLEALADACQEFDITPAEVKKALSPEDIECWHNGSISRDVLATFVRSWVQRGEMNQGKRPAHYSEHATCQHCGPIWLWISGEVLSCPWCWNRIADKPIPRPCSVHCGDCIHFKHTDHPHLGNCAKNDSGTSTELRDSDERDCEYFIPKPKHSNDDHSKPETAK